MNGHRGRRVKAMIFETVGRSLRRVERETPLPRPGQVLVGGLYCRRGIRSGINPTALVNRQR
jgi:hypothetical protein